MTIIKVNLHDDGISRNNLSGYNNLTNAATTGVRFADLLDSSGATTGVSLTQNGAFTGDLGAASIATSSPDPDFEFEFFNSYFYAGSSEIANATFTMAGLPAGASYTLKLSGASDNDVRDTSFTATDGSPSPALYNNVTADPPTAPVTISGTVPGNGEVTISLAIVSTFAYLNGWQIEYTAATGPSITTADNITSEGDTATFTLSGNTAAPTAVTVNGTAGTDLTFVSEDTGAGTETYSYTAPLIADDATADLVVSVDSTTASAAISYANSLPYALTAHAEPDANSVMFGNQFGTTGPVELAEPVLVSGDAAAATIYWAAMDAAQGWTADINTYATANEDGTQTWEFTYLIAETNQTGTFQRTFTVDYPFSKGIRYAAPQNWTWGKRHPKTGMRVRIYK